MLDLDTKVEIYTNLSQSASMINYLRRYFAAQIGLSFHGFEFLLYMHILIAIQLIFLSNIRLLLYISMRTEV